MTTSLSTGDGVRRAVTRRAPTGFPTVWFVGAVVLAVALSSVSYLAYRRYHPTYQAAAAIAFDQPRAIATATDAGEIQKLSQLRLLYAGLVKTDVMTKVASEHVQLPRDVIAASAYTSAQPGSLLLIVGAHRPNPTEAKLIAEALADEVVLYVKQVQAGAHVPVADRISADIVLHANTAAQISPTDKRRLSVAILTGILVFAIVLGVGALVRRRPVIRP